MLPRKSDYTKAFEKDWERLSHSGRYDMGELKKVISLLIENDAPLPEEYRDHELLGKLKGTRECHVGGDFLLLYSISPAGGVQLLRTGTHSELLE